tara:strand:- start:1564 stop:2421 length:858 start_codon:yes stop_codon:yes gene_type:complete
MQTITWNGFTIQTDSHPLPCSASMPGINNGNLWLPANVQVLQNGNLQMSIQKNSGCTWNNNGVPEEIWAASEAVFQNTLSYGTYCCTFKFTDADGNLAWDQFALSNSTPPALNMTTTFGVFLYDPTNNGGDNPFSEIDMIEVGYQNQANNGSGWIGQQPGGPSLNNAQFALQPWDAGSPGQPNFDMVRRIALDISKIKATASGEVTILMKWTAAGAPVEYSLAYGAYNSTNWPSKGTISYTTPTSVNSYVPALSSTMQLHLNLWPYGGPSTGDPVYCEITNLEMP